MQLTSSGIGDHNPYLLRRTSEGTHRFRSWKDPTHALSAQTAESNGLLAGIVTDDSSGSTWDPYGKATRGEVAQILWLLRQRLGS